VALAAEEQLRGFLAGLRRADPERIIRRITFCEIDARKYGVLLRRVRRVAAQTTDESLRIVVDEAQPAGVAGRSRSRQVARAETVARRDPVYLLTGFDLRGRDEIQCRTSLLTAGAKAAVLSGSTTFTRHALTERLAPLETGRATIRDMSALGEALARLLLVPTVREGLATLRTRGLVVVHDREASRVPWEVLRVGDSHPALAGGLSRRFESETLSVARWRDEPLAGERLRVLLIVNPTGDLPGAAEEGRAVETLLREAGATLAVLEGKDASRARILATLANDPHDVLHFAGHAFFEARDPARRHRTPARARVLQCLRSGARAAPRQGAETRAAEPLVQHAAVRSGRRGVLAVGRRGELHRHALASGRRRGVRFLARALCRPAAR
jgi:hypothetical protein